MSNSDTTSSSLAVINSLNQGAFSGSTVRGEGAGKAYQVAAQASAIAVQDATDSLRNSSSILTTSLGVAMAQLLATGDPKYAQIAELSVSLNDKLAANFKNVGTNAAEVLQKFPSS